MAIHSKERADLKAEIAELEARTLSSDFFSGLRTMHLNGRKFLDGISPEDDAVLTANIDPATFNYGTTYQWDISKPIPKMLRHARYSYNLQPRGDNLEFFPDIDVGNTRTDYLYYYTRSTSATALGVTSPNIAIPETWRNGVGIFRVIFERLELTSEHQTKIAQQVEREIIAGMGGAYTSASTNTRIIDFASTSAGANDGLDVADLVADGWEILNTTQLGKYISTNGATARRWRITHNAL